MNTQKTGEATSATRAAESFARIEKKYLVKRAIWPALSQALHEHLQEGPFGRGSVSSLYYDTPRNNMITASMGKPFYKEKLRIRAYGEPAADEAVFVELKTKVKGSSYKRRVATSCGAAQAWLAGMLYAEACARFPLRSTIHRTASSSSMPSHHPSESVSLQIVREIDAARKRHAPLSPSIMTIVERVALTSASRSDVRVTFDFDARWRMKDLSFDTGLSGTPLFADGCIIMEVKCQGAYPLWLAQLLSRFCLRPQPCSKVCRALEAARQIHPIGTLSPDSQQQSLQESTAQWLASNNQFARYTNYLSNGRLSVSEQSA